MLLNIFQSIVVSSFYVQCKSFAKLTFYYHTASSIWVTAVGGTRFIDQQVDKDEMATDEFGSGGGIFPFPNQVRKTNDSC